MGVPDLRGFFALAIFGLVCGALTVLVGVPLAIYWLTQHIAIVGF